MKRIALSQGKVAIVDDEDFEELNNFKWYSHRQGNTFYAGRQITVLNENSRQRSCSMHRSIMNPQPGFEIDHIDGDGLNNQKSNLRVVTKRQQQQNQQNRIVPKVSQFPGVYWHKQRQKWGVQIEIGGKKNHLGLFEVEEEAHQKYLEKVICICNNTDV